MDWLKLKPFKLNAMVLIPKAVNQIPTTGHAASKKCKERLTLQIANALQGLLKPQGVAVVIEATHMCM